MLLTILKSAFYLVSSLLVITFGLRVMFENAFRSNNKLSPIVAAIGALFMFYILNALLLALVLPSVKQMSVMLIFALFPFIIGKLVTYKKLKLYSFIQILCVILSMIFVLLL